MPAETGTMVVKLDLGDVPEMLEKLRKELADILRGAADAEKLVPVGDRLRELADIFEGKN